ncbi:MAG: peptidoglycan editing factor PgeF [Propionibacteriaceae bacterium]|nr:peptidoglycan editing factor PgeF [Propionibacteriaceae bacterium]
MSPRRDPRVGYLFTDRHGGVSPAPFDSMNLGRIEEDGANVEQNFDLLRQKIPVTKFALCSQVHGTLVHEVTDDYPFTCRVEDHAQADGLVTTLPGIALVVRVADCVPVLLADPHAQVIAAAHAGREGLLAGIVEATVAAMVDLGASDIQGWIGPHICVNCYEVSPEMAQRSWSLNPRTKGTSRRGTPAINLEQGVRGLLEDHGVQVHLENSCTSCEDRYFSHRRDHGLTGRQAGVIWLKEGGTPRVDQCTKPPSGNLDHVK